MLPLIMSNIQEITLHGTITEVSDYKGDEEVRRQVIEVVLDENFWQIVYLKKKKIKVVIDKEQIPKELL